ncbi:uncharacterized protein BX664DRAFT_329038, partial [Halteromyces radiatus]|uniref:uncharacterized protein n=1 Tax=Halteromyces radiatus TaxID=101107 RepID=UPI002220C9F1
MVLFTDFDLIYSISISLSHLFFFYSYYTIFIFQLVYYVFFFIVCLFEHNTLSIYIFINT